MTKDAKKQPKKPSNFITAIRSQKNPAMAALISRATTADGYPYLYFELSRAWKAKTGNVGYSTKFYERNAEGVAEVVEQAARWIREHPDAADGVVADRELSEAA